MVLKKDFRESPKKLIFVFGLLGIYVSLVFLSSIRSPYHEYAWKGMMEQYESIFVVMGYVLICVYAYMACCQEGFVAFGIFCGIIGGIGTFQFLGMDIYRTGFLQKMILPKAFERITVSITAEAGRSYCSLSNPNYVGMFCCLTIPVLIMLAACSETLRGRMLYSISGVLMFLSLLGSRSKSGIAVFAVCMALLAILFRKNMAVRLKLQQKIVDSAVVCMIMIICIMAGMLVYKWGKFWEYDAHPDTAISEIVASDNGVKIVYRGKVLIFDIDYSSASLREAFSVVDENSHIYDVSEKEGVIHFEEKSLSNLTASVVQYGDYVALEIWDGKFYWYFTDQAGGDTWNYLTCYGKPDKIDSSEIPVWKWLEGKERIASGRGYIWSRTLPLIRKYIFLGSGQDSFTIVFPNHDYLGKARWGYKDMLITKPHCMYMQIAVQSGLVSLIVLFVFWGYFLMKSFSKCADDVLLKAIAIGVMGYLLMGFTNDSNVGVAPVFWLLVGMGLRMC